MADLKRLAVQRKAERFEAAGLTDQAKKAKAQLAELDAPALSMDNTKAELLAAAEGLDVDESNTKAEILEALNV